MKWIAATNPPPNGTDCILYREDAGVFVGFYGNVAENLLDADVEELYNKGMTEESAWECCFWAFSFGGLDRMELDLIPEFWMPLPDPPN